MLSNNDIKESDLIASTAIVRNTDFTYGSFISNYSKDDLDLKLRAIIIDLVKIATESYQNAFNAKQVTSVSNHFKTDTKYYDQVLSHFVDCLDMSFGLDIKAKMDIFKRK